MDEEYVAELEARLEQLEQYAIYEYEQRIQFLSTTLAQIAEDIGNMSGDCMKGVRRVAEAKSPGYIPLEEIQKKIADSIISGIKRYEEKVCSKIKTICHNLDKAPPSKDELRKRTRESN